MFCGNCGKELEETAVFCTYCGSKVEHKKKEKCNKSILGLAIGVAVVLLAGVVIFGSNGKKEERISDFSSDDIISNAEVMTREEEILSKEVQEEAAPSKTVQQEATSSNVVQDDYPLSSEEERIFELRNAEMEKQSMDYDNLAIEPAKYVGKLCEGYNEDSGEILYDIYYLWLKQEQEVDYITASGEIRTKKVKGMILESDNLNPLVGEDIICYGKTIESDTEVVNISLIPAAVIPVREDLKNCTYKETPNVQNDTDAKFLDNIRQSYKNLIGMDILDKGQIMLKDHLEMQHMYYGNIERKFDVYGGYMLEDLDNNNVPELIVQGMMDNNTVFFILDHELRTSIVPGEILYNVPGKNLFYTANGYDDYTFYACWHRQSHSGNYVGPSGRYAYMKAFENCAYVDSNGEYVGYDYTNVVLGQNTLRKESRDVSNRLDEVFAISESPQVYEYNDLSAFDRW